MKTIEELSEEVSRLRIALLQITVATQALIGLNVPPTTDKQAGLLAVAAESSTMAEGIVNGESPRTSRLMAGRRYLAQAHRLRRTG